MGMGSMVGVEKYAEAAGEPARDNGDFKSVATFRWSTLGRLGTNSGNSERHGCGTHPGHYRRSNLALRALVLGFHRLLIGLNFREVIGSHGSLTFEDLMHDTKGFDLT